MNVLTLAENLALQALGPDLWFSDAKQPLAWVFP